MIKTWYGTDYLETWNSNVAKSSLQFLIITN